jgi:hypothetical protein
MTRHSSREEARKLGAFLRMRVNAQAADRKDRAAWTTAVQHSLDEYRKEQNWAGSEVLPPPNYEFPDQGRKDSFLLDFVVWRRDIDGDKEGAWIACESEWNLDRASVVKDFQKLLSFRAPYKIMVYDVKYKQKLSAQCREEFEATLSKFSWHLEDEVYIFIEFLDGERIANVYTCVPSESSTLTPV